MTDLAFLGFLAAVLTLGGLGAWVLLGWRRFVGYHRYKRLDPPPLPPGELLAYVVAEVGAMCTLAWWHVRAAFADGMRQPAGPPSGPPVLCIHGITQNGSNLWGIRRALRARGRATRAVSLGLVVRGLEAHMPPLEAALREVIAASPDGRIDVVAHSMGGVVFRMVIAAHPELARHLRRVVTLATPHAGTAFQRGLPLGETARRLGRRSTLLVDLPGLPRDVEVTTIAARHDFIVYPLVTCHVEGGHAIELPGVGHAGLLTRRIAIEAVADAICGERPALASAPPGA